MTYGDVNNREDIINSRDVIARIEELRDSLEEYRETTDERPLTLDEAAERDEFEAELTILEALAEEGEGYDDWHHGETLIRETYFEDYARQLADDIGAVPEEFSWPASYIDWEAAAEALKMDYGTVEFDGVTYYIR